MTIDARGPAVASGFLLTGPRSLRWQSQALPEMPDDWVRVRFLYCGLCGSDLSKFEGRREITYPVSLGHEFIAEVVAVGAEVTGLEAGHVVTSDLNYRCESCDQCRAQRSHLCREGQAGLFTNRAFADLGDFHASYLVPLNAPPLRQFALVEPLSCVLHAKDWAAPGPGDRVLIIGAGGLGTCMAFALWHASQPFEITDVLTSRLALAQAAAEPIGRAVGRPTGEFDIVFDLSGSESGLRAGCHYVKPGGKLCSMSHLDGYSNGDFLLGALTRRDVTFTVSYLNGERETLRRAASALEEAWSGPWDHLMDVVPLKGLPEAFATRRTAPRCKTVVAIAPSG